MLLGLDFKFRLIGLFMLEHGTSKCSKCYYFPHCSGSKLITFMVLLLFWYLNLDLLSMSYLGLSHEISPLVNSYVVEHLTYEKLAITKAR